MACGARASLATPIIVADDESSARTRVTKELWLNSEAGRFMTWGRFDDCITAVLLAKDPRAQLRKAGLRNADNASKAYALHRFVTDELRFRSLRAQLAG